jgi:hypothetical protein
MVQGCTFKQEGRHVLAGRQVASAILLGNQASGGFEVENQAGSRTQMLANEQDTVVWTSNAKRHYRIEVGEEGDGRYLRNWHNRERLPQGDKHGTMRWSTSVSRLLLPVLPDQPYTLSLEINVPQQAVSHEAGVYLNGSRLAPLRPGPSTLRIALPPAKTERMVLEIRCAGWIPRKVERGSQDERTLGINLYSATMRAQGAAAPPLFNANTGVEQPGSLQQSKR